MGKREREREDVHARAPREDLVFVASDLEASAVLFEADHCNVGKPLLPYRLHQRPRHDMIRYSSHDELASFFFSEW